MRLLALIFGEGEVLIGGYYCDRHRDTHPDGMRCCRICDRLHEGVTPCPQQVIGTCTGACAGRTRDLDRFGNCEACGSSAITERRFVQRGGAA